MLTYNNQASYSMMFQCLTGSVVPRAATWGMLSALLTLIFSVAFNPQMRGDDSSADSASSSVVRAALQGNVGDDLFSQPYSHYIISYMLGFLMIFRVQLSYARYWEGIQHLYESLNRLNCAAGMVVAFDELAEGDAAIRGLAWRRHMMHLFSLLAGTQLLEIRFSDLELSELYPLHRVLVERPACEVGTARLLKLNERVLQKLVTRPAPSDSDSGVSAALSAMMDRYPVEILDGVAADEKAHLELHAPVFDQAVNTRIVRLISKRLNEGGLAMPPPIVSRIYQEIALGNTAFKQALKVSRIRFPFPYAQLLEVVKFFVICVTPLVVLAKTDSAASTPQAWINTLWSMLHAFFVSFNFVAMTKVAQEMEDPFGVDPNDLPLLSMHDEFNSRLERLLNERPPAVDFAYNPNSMYTQNGRCAMFEAMGDGSRSPSSSSPTIAAAACPGRPQNLTISTSAGQVKGIGGSAGSYDTLVSPCPSGSGGATPTGGAPSAVPERRRSSTFSPRLSPGVPRLSPGVRWSKAAQLVTASSKAQLQV